MCQPVSGIFKLALAGTPVELQIKLIEHSEAGCPDGMAETLQAAVHLAGNFTVPVVKPIHHIPIGPPSLRDVKIFHGDQLGNRKTVMDLQHVDLFPGSLNAGLFIGRNAAFAGGDKMVTVPVVIAQLLPAAQCQLKGLNADKILLAQLPGHVGGGNNRTGGAVADSAAVKQP